MAYNLQPLITILQQILNPQQSRWILDHNRPQLESLLQKAASLQQILEKASLPKNIESLESQIREAAHKTEDMIESQMVDQMLSSPEGVRSSFPITTPDLQQVMQQLDSVMEQVVKLAEEKTMPSGSSSSGASKLQDPNSKSVVVGVDEDMMQLKDRLTRMQSKLEIVPIVGMGGIGKTTLARKLYQDPSIVDHFSYLAWTTISQDYNMRAILLSILRCIIGKEKSEDHIKKGNGDLKDILYRSLYGKRYMIVLDDIWSTKFWDEIRMYFPDNNNRSRIVITTRESDVAKYADSKSLHHQVQLLNKSKSWNLFRQIVFGEEECPHELQGIGEKISSDCGGLPLAISVIGGLLSKVERSKDVWENIGDNVRAAIGESDKQFSNILSLSYNHLPLHLKPCFLYMAPFLISVGFTLSFSPLPFYTHHIYHCFYLRFSSATMSWQSYIDDHLMADIDGCHLTSSAIVGHDGSVWAQSNNFPQFKPEEVTAIMNDFDNPGSLAPTGLYIGGTKYMVIQGEPNAVIRGKKGSGGATIKKTTLALIIGIYDEPMTPGQCNMVVEKIGDYLIEQGL